MLLDAKTRFFVMFVGQQDGPRGKRHPRQMTQLHTRQTLNCASRMYMESTGTLADATTIFVSVNKSGGLTVGRGDCFLADCLWYL